MIKLHETETVFLLADFLYCLLGIHVSMKQAITLQRLISQPGTEVHNPTTHKELNSVDNHMSSLQVLPHSGFQITLQPALAYAL